MPDFEQIIKSINAVLQLVFGKNVPSWLSLLIGILLIIGLVLCAIWGLLFLLSKIIELWTKSILPLFYDKAEKQRCLRRKYFAEHIESEIVKLGRQEEWKDYRFTELEAEVEAEGYRKRYSFVPFLRRTTNTSRREKSLSKALASSQERLILVEGEPGSGKSIALRHVAQALASKAKITQSTKSTIPIYVNLKELERQPGEQVDRNLIESFVLKSLKRINDRDIERFLDDEFKIGIEDGTWFFFFDSFDELPEVLSSTEADVVIKNYGNAIDNFLHGMNRCRGIVASRQFRGPTYFGWPRFLIQNLSEKRRLELIRKVGLKSELENELVGQLANANDEIRSMASNPLFLNLLCEHIKNGHSFPKNVHTVFETYIGNRLTRDEKSVRRRFQLGISQIRSFAENIAFCMVADTGLGLSPTRENLKEAVKRLYNGVDENFESYLDALEFMKLGRSEEVLGAVQSKTFTFAHRRFQEYFATCVVLREPTRVSPHQLLCDARWRETAVVMFQTQPIQELRIYIAEADKLLNDHCSTISTLIASPLEYLLPESKHKTDDQNELLSVDFPWPSGCFHLLSLLQDGFTSRLIDLPEDIRMNISRLVLTATETGTLYDKKSSLEVAGTVPEPILVYLLRSAFANKSQWLREVAYRQVARLTNISPDIATGIRIAIVELAMFKRLRREQQATRAHIARINGSMDFLSVMLLLLFLPVIDISINVFLIILLVTISISANAISLSEILLLTILLSFSFLYLRVLISPFLYTLIPFWSNTVLLRRNSPLTFFYRTQSYFKNFSFRKVNNRNTKSKRNRRAFGKYFYHLLMPSIFWSIFLLTKFGLLLIPIYVLSRIHSKVLVGASLIFVVSYLLLFTPLALFAAVFGQFSRRRWWLLLPLWPLLYLLKNFKSIIKVSLKLIRECYFSVILLALFFSIYAILLIFIGNLLSDFTKSHERFMEYLGIISLCLFSLVFSIWIVREINKWIPDLFKWYRWTKMQKKPMTWQELVSNLCLYHTDLYRTRLLKFVCEKRLLIATEETETILKSLALETELKQKNNQVVEKDKILPIQVISPDSEKNITTKYSAIINNASSDFLDALYILIEDLHLMIVNI